MKNKALEEKQRSERQGGKFFPALCNLLGTLILLSVIVTCLPLTLPRLLGYEIYHVVSGSMEPEIPVGSVVYVAPVPPESVSAGEVIAFQSGDSVVIHRVVNNQFVVGEYVTKGDANDVEDMNTVPYDALIGHVVFRVPVLGRILTLYASTIGKLYVLCFAACGVMFHILADRLRDR